MSPSIMYDLVIAMSFSCVPKIGVAGVICFPVLYLLL